MNSVIAEWMARQGHMMTRPWRHPIVVAMAVGMAGMAFYLLVNGVYGMACSMNVSNNAIDKLVRSEFVGDWPSLLAGIIWISIFAAAVIQCARYLVKLTKLRMSECTSFKGLEKMNEVEVNVLGQWIDGASCEYPRLKRLWS